MSPLPHSSALFTLAKRDGANLTAGQIAGIIVGIVVVALFLLGLFIWRLLSYRKDFGPYTAKGRQSSAREKALAQGRGGNHVRSTRARDPDVQTFDEKSGLVASNSKQHDLEEGVDSRRPSPIPEDAQSVAGTVGEVQRDHEDDIDAAKGKQRQQEIDYEIHQGHHATALPAQHHTLATNDNSNVI
jgi:hypothetical protein